MEPTPTPKPIAAILVVGAFALGLVGAYRLGQGRPERADPVVTAAAAVADPAATTAADTAGAPLSGDVAVDIVDFAFAPDPLRITAGATVTWTNKDSFAHTATGDGDAPAFDTGNLDQGTSASHTFDAPGTFTYLCAIHNSMTGTVVVE